MSELMSVVPEHQAVSYDRDDDEGVLMYNLVSAQARLCNDQSLTSM